MRLAYSVKAPEGRRGRRIFKQGAVLEYPFSGEVFIHAVKRAQVRQVEWLLRDILDYQVPLIWMPQTELEGCLRTGFAWQGEASSGAELTSALAGWKDIYFEVTQDPFDAVSASRWMYTPQLGIKHRITDEFGNFLIGEGELRAALHRANNNVLLSWEVKNLLADSWEEALEPMRSQLNAAPVAKIRRVS
jgi:hypothetical protein